MQRRNFLRGVGLGASVLGGAAFAQTPLGAVAESPAPPVGKPAFAPVPTLAPVKASPDRIISIDVCTRPFRAQGPRMEQERLGRKTVIHSYGHGGSGWSLSWGAGEDVARLLRATGQNEIAIIGCGAIGLTAARVAQKYGFRVRIYAKEWPPEVRSSYATGVWSPASRVATAEHATPEFRASWERMARTSWRMFQGLLGLPDEPVVWRDSYALSDVPRDSAERGEQAERGEPEYPRLSLELIEGHRMRSVELSPSEHPFSAPYVRRSLGMVFNISAYSKMLLNDFLIAGGSLQTREFESIRDIERLPERVIVNATGYGARALLGDDSIVPVRGQTLRLAPQPEVNYGLHYAGHNVSMTARSDGLLVQSQAPGDFGNPDTTPDHVAILRSVEALARAFA